MTLEYRLGQLPRPGPFKLKGSFVPKQLMQGLFWFLLVGAVGGGLTFYGLYLSSELLESSHVWHNGKEALQTLGYRGSVRTTNFIFKSYDLKVHYRDANGDKHIKRVEFFRFFSGPGKGDAYTVRYMPKDPQRAVFSWAYEARYHGWFFALMMIAFGLLCLFGTYALTASFVGDIILVRRMAKKGYLIAGSIQSIIDVRNEETGAIETIYKYSFQRETVYEGEYAASKESEHPILLNDATELVLLVEQTGDEHKVLRQDGYPLVI